MNKTVVFFATPANSYFNLPNSTVPINDSSYTIIVNHKAINSMSGHWLCGGTPSTLQELGFRRSLSNYLNYCGTLMIGQLEHTHRIVLLLLITTTQRNCVITISMAEVMRS